MVTRPRIVFMGTPGFAVTSLEHLLLNRHNVAAVYTQPDKVAGRGRGVSTPPVKQVAARWGLPVRQPPTLKTAGAESCLAELKPDVVVVAAFGQIIPEAMLGIPPRGFLNIHPSLLPKYRGVSPVAAAILAGDAFTGVSIMQLDRGVDTGPVLARAQAPVIDHDTAGLLTEKLARIGSALLLEVLPRWLAGTITAIPQDEARASYCRMIEKSAGRIDWNQPAAAIARQVRAYQPWPGSYTCWKGKQLKVIEAAPLQDAGVGVGLVVPVDDAFGVGTGSGTLGIRSLQLEGKRVMTAAEFLRGHSQVIGAVLVG